MTSSFEPYNCPEDYNEECIRNTFLNAAFYPHDLTGSRIIYDGYFDSLKRTDQFNYLRVIQDNRFDARENSDQDNLIIGDLCSFKQSVCAKDYLLLGKDDHLKPSYKILEEHIGFKL